MLLEALSVSHGKASAHLPVIDLLHGYFAIEAVDDGRKRREKVTGRVVALDRTLEETLPYLCALLGLVEGEDPLAQMDGQVKKRRTLGAIKRILLRESLNQPLMVIFEDLHWIDRPYSGLVHTLLGAGVVSASMFFPPAFAALGIVDHSHVGESFDLMIGLDGQRIHKIPDFQDALSKVRFGDVIYLTIVRGGKRLQIAMRVTQ